MQPRGGLAVFVYQVFTNPLPLALLLWAARPDWWLLLAAATVARAAAATAGLALRDPLVARYWWLVPLQDIASFAAWLTGFVGNTIIWRGRRYYLRRDGTFTPLA